MNAATRRRVLIFDNDGTLVPSHETANPAIIEAFGLYCQREGLDLPLPTDARIRELTGQPGETFYRSLLPVHLADHAPALREFCLDIEVEAMRLRCRFYPGIGPMLEALRGRGDRMALASHGGRRYIGAVAERLGYADLFSRIFYHGYEGLLGKGDMARRALDELGPGEGILIGDREADKLAAREAGIRFVGCLYGYGTPEELADADDLAATPEALASILLNGA